LRLVSVALQQNYNTGGNIMIDYSRLGEFTQITQQKMKCIENALRNGPKTTQQLQDVLRENHFGNSLRNVQEAIKNLNYVYYGENHIGRGTLHKLEDIEVNLAFPELVFNTNDRKIISQIMQIAVFFEGAIPVKEIFKASGLTKRDVDAFFTEIKENADVPISSEEARLMSQLYDAIEKKNVVEFPYDFLKDIYYGDIIHVSPYYLRQYNNKWFLIGHVENLPRKDVGFNYPWSVFPLRRILSKKKGVIELKISNNKYKYKDIDKTRIHNYYKKVMGFYVPTLKGEPFKEQLTPLHIEIDVKSNNMFRQICENPIHESQKKDVRSQRITINVVESPVLYSKLMSYGSDIEVISPESVRIKLHNKLIDVLNIYNK